MREHTELRRAHTQGIGAGPDEWTAGPHGGASRMGCRTSSRTAAVCHSHMPWGPCLCSLPSHPGLGGEVVSAAKSRGAEHNLTSAVYWGPSLPFPGSRPPQAPFPAWWQALPSGGCCLSMLLLSFMCPLSNLNITGPGDPSPRHAQVMLAPSTAATALRVPQLGTCRPLRPASPALLSGTHSGLCVGQQTPTSAHWQQSSVCGHAEAAGQAHTAVSPALCSETPSD